MNRININLAYRLGVWLILSHWIVTFSSTILAKTVPMVIWFHRTVKVVVVSCERAAVCMSNGSMLLLSSLSDLFSFSSLSTVFMFSESFLVFVFWFPADAGICFVVVLVREDCGCSSPICKSRLVVLIRNDMLLSCVSSTLSPGVCSFKEVPVILPHPTSSSELALATSGVR